MARKRLNIKFVVVAACVLVLLASGAVAYKFRKQILYGSPQTLVDKAKQLMAEENWEEAGRTLYDAGTMDRSNPEIYVLLGDVHDHLTGDGEENFRKAGGFWSTALSIDPAYLPALERMLERQREIAAIQPHPNTYSALRDIAQKYLAADPDERKARLALHMSTMQLASTPGAIDPAAVEESRDALRKMNKEDPSDADAMAQIAADLVTRAGEAYRAGDDAGMERLLGEAVALVESSLVGQENNPDMHFRAGNVYMMIAGLERSIRREFEPWEERARTEATRARELVKPGDEKYLEIQIFQARLLERQRDFDGAEKIFRELMEVYPKDQGVKLALAQLLGQQPARRKDAMAVLSEPLPLASELAGIKALQAGDYEAATLAQLLELKLDDFGSVPPEQRAAVIQETDQQLARLISLRGERPNSLLLRGRLQVFKGDWVGAVQSFNACLRSSEPGPSPLQRVQAMNYLAKAYIATNQAGQAKRQLLELIRFMDSFPGGEAGTASQRMDLIEILLNENNPEEAKPHVEVLTKLLEKDDPRLLIAQLAALDRTTEKAQMRKVWDQLPESERAMVVDKARIAMRFLDDDDAAAKLLDKYRKQHPEDVDMVQSMAQLYLSMDRKPDAVKLVNDALAANAGNERLQRLLTALTTEQTPEDRLRAQQEYADSAADPFVRELRRFDIANAQNRPDDALAHLLEADKLSPDNVRVLDLLLRSYAMRQDWAKAETYLNRLAKVNPDAARFQRVRLSLARGQAREAFEEAQQLTRERGDFAQSWLMLAAVQYHQGNLLEAMASYRNALDRDSRSLDAMQGLIECYYRTNNPAEARRYIDQALRIYPDNVAMTEQSLQHELQFGDPEKVIPARQEQLRKEQDNPAAWLALAQAHFAAARAKSGVAREADAKAHLGKAREALDQGYAKFPDDQRFAGSIAEVAIKVGEPDDGDKAIRALMQRPAWKDRPEPALMLADYLVAAGKTDDAEQVYRDLFAQTKDLSIQLRLADLVNQQKGIDAALTVLHDNADQLPVRRMRVELLLRSGKIEEAQKELDALAAASQPNAVVLELQSAVFMAANKPVEAMDSVNKALALDPRYAPALYRRGLLRLNTRGDADGAVQDLSMVREIAPTLIDARIQLARALRAKGETDLAIRELESVVRDAPGEKAPRLELVRLYGEAVPPRWSDAERVLRDAREVPQLARDAAILRAEANLFATRNDMQRALASIREAAQVAPNDLEVARTFFDILNKAKQYRDVLAISDRMLKSDPNVWWLYQARGIAKNRMDDKDGSLLEFEKALTVATEQGNDPAAQEIVQNIAQEVGFGAAMRRVEPRAQTDNRWRFVAAQLCRSQADFAAGIKYVQMMLDDPALQGTQRDMVMDMAGQFYCNMNPPNHAKATEIYRTLVDNNPDNPFVLNNLAAVMSMPNAPYKPEEALVYSERAFANMQRSGNLIPEIMDTHGSILVKVGRVDEGIGLLLSAIDRKPLPDAYYHLGDAYLKKSQPDQAESMLRQAKELIARAERDREPVDPTLKERVEQALIQASTLKSKQG